LNHHGFFNFEAKQRTNRKMESWATFIVPRIADRLLQYRLDSRKENCVTVGVGGKSIEEALAGLADMTSDVPRIQKADFADRLERFQALLTEKGIGAAYIHAGTNLYYLTGLRWNPSERMVSALIPAEGEIAYVAPRFELDTLRDYWQMEAPILAWEEHENPNELVRDWLVDHDAKRVAVDEVTPFFIYDGLKNSNPQTEFITAQPLTQALRSRKTPAEIALIKRAHEMTLEVHKAAASILRPGIRASEVSAFIDDAHRKVGAPAGSFFCIVLFDVGTSFPHGVKDDQTLRENDWVLIDTGCLLDGYNSDITRSFCFGTPTDAHRVAWQHEKDAQLAGFAAAKLGEPCEACDAAARQSLVDAGYGPEYRLPGLPHRTGHGCGLDIHEGPNLVKGETTVLDVGMVFSCEPMLVIPDQFGIRLEDHFYMSDSGPVWFTQPSKSIDDPFGICAH